MTANEPKDRAVDAVRSRTPHDGPERQRLDRWALALAALHLDIPLRELVALAQVAIETADDERYHDAINATPRRVHAAPESSVVREPSGRDNQTETEHGPALSERRRLVVDWSRLGYTTRFRVPTRPAERADLVTGDLITVVGDDAPDHLARVLHASADDVHVQLELVEDAPTDLNAEDDRGYRLARLARAPDPTRLVPEAVLVVGRPGASCWARVIEVKDGFAYLEPIDVGP